MKQHLAIAIIALASVCLPRVTDAADNEEDALIAILQSGQGERRQGRCLSPPERDRDCQVRAPRWPDVLSTAGSVMRPARALESLPGPGASEVLRAALGKTTGSTRVGIIDSLGMRRDEQAIPQLAALLMNTDPSTLSAAARSLGRIGTREALPPLQDALKEATAATRPALSDALLRCADALRIAGHQATAAKTFGDLFEAKHVEAVRLAAYRSLVLASGAAAPQLLTKALQGDDDAARQAALQLATELPGREVTMALVAQLEQGSLPVRLALLKALGQRGDGAALAAVAAATKSPEAAVRRAALDTLIDLGDASTVPLLAGYAGRPGPDQEAARGALARLHRGDVRQAIVELYKETTLPTQLELLRALGSRREPQSLGFLLQQAEAANERLQIGAVPGCGRHRRYGGPGHVDPSAQFLAVCSCAASTTRRPRRDRRAAATGRGGCHSPCLPP